MNIKSEPLSDREGAEADIFFPALRRSPRVRKNTLDFSSVKPRRKKKTSNEDKDAICGPENPSSQISVKVEKSSLEIPLDREDGGGSPFLITLDPPVAADLEDLEEMAHSSESTLTAHSDVGSVASAESLATVSEEDPIFQEHSYCSNPRRTVRTHIKKEKKTMEAAPVAPKPTVDLSTLAIYRALMDHNYSTITPSALIEAVMLKHDYVCTFQALQDFSADMEPYEPVATYLNHQRVKTEPGTVLQVSQRDNIDAKPDKNLVPNTKKGRKRKSPEDKLLQNPKYKSSTKTPKLTSKDGEQPVKSPKLPADELPVKSPLPKKTVTTENAISKESSKKKKQSAKAKTSDTPLKKGKEKEHKSLASKIKVQLRLKKRKRRKNTTGWPTKRPQAADKKPKKLSKPKKDVTKVKNEKPSRESSTTRSVEKESKDEIIPSLTGIVLSIEEAVKRRRQSIAKPTPAEKPHAGSEKHKKTRSDSPKQTKSQTATKSPVEGKWKSEEKARITGDDSEAKEKADENPEKSATVEEQLGTETESQLLERSQTAPSKDQTLPKKSPRILKKTIKLDPAADKAVDPASAAESSKAASEPKVSLRKRVKRQISSLFKKKGSSKQTGDGKGHEGDVAPKKKRRKAKQVDETDVGTDTATEVENAKNTVTTKPAIKNRREKLKWIRKQLKQTTKQSEDANTQAKSKPQIKKLRNRMPSLSPPTRRGDTYGNIDCTEGITTFPTVIIKEEPMETEIPDDSQVTEWDHFQNEPSDAGNPPANTLHCNQIVKNGVAANFNHRIHRKSVPQTELEAFAHLRTPSGCKSNDLTCYEDLGASEGSNGSHHSRTRTRRLQSKLSGAPPRKAAEVSNVQRCSSETESCSSPDEASFGDGDNSAHSLSTVQEMVKAVNEPFRFSFSATKEEAQTSSLQKATPTTSEILKDSADLENTSSDNLTVLTTEHQIETTQNTELTPQAISVANVPYSEKSTESRISVASPYQHLADELERKDDRTVLPHNVRVSADIIENTAGLPTKAPDEVKPKSSGTSVPVPKCEQTTATPCLDVEDHLLKKRREERRLARERRMKKRYALKKQEFHQTKFFNQNVLIGKSKPSRITREASSSDETDPVAPEVSDTVNATTDLSAADCRPIGTLAEDPSATTDKLGSNQTQDSIDGPKTNIDSSSPELGIHNIPKLLGLEHTACESFENVQEKFIETPAKRQTNLSTEAESSVKLYHGQKNLNDLRTGGTGGAKQSVINPQKQPEACCAEVEEVVQDITCGKHRRRSINNTPQEGSAKESEKSTGNVMRVAEVATRNSLSRTDPANRDRSGQVRLLRRKCAHLAEGSSLPQDTEDASDFHDEPLSSNENCDVDSNSKTMGFITVPEASEPQSIKRTRVPVRKELRTIPRIIRHKSATIGINKVRCIQSTHGVNSGEKRSLNAAKTSQNVGVEFPKELKSHECKIVSVEASTNHSLQKVVEHSMDKSASPSLVGSAEILFPDAGNVPENQAPSRPVPKESGHNARSTFDVHVADTRSGVQSCGITMLEHWSSDFQRVMGRTDSLASADHACGRTRVDCPNSNADSVCIVEKVPDESISVDGSVDNPVSQSISKSNQILTVAPHFKSLPEEVSGYDSDFSIIDPYASDSDDHTVQPLQPRKYKREEDTVWTSDISNTTGIAVQPVDSTSGIGVEGVDCLSSAHKEQAHGFEKLANPADIANNEGVKGVIIADPRFALAPKQLVDDAEGRVPPVKLTENPSVQANRPGKKVIAKCAVIELPNGAKLAAGRPGLDQKPRAPRVDHEYCMNPLKKKCDPATRKKERNARKNERRRLLKELQAREKQAKELAKNHSKLCPEPVVLRRNAENVITRIDGLLSNVDALTDVASETPEARGGSESHVIDSDEEYLPWMDDEYRKRSREARRKLLREKQKAKKLMEKALQQMDQPCGDRDPLGDVPEIQGLAKQNFEGLTESAEAVEGVQDPLADAPVPVRKYQGHRPNPMPVTPIASKPSLTSLLGQQSSLGHVDDHQKSQPQPKNQSFQKRTYCYKLINGQMQFQGQMNEVTSQLPGNAVPTSNLGLNAVVGQAYKMNFKGSDGKSYNLVRMMPREPDHGAAFATAAPPVNTAPTLPGIYRIILPAVKTSRPPLTELPNGPQQMVEAPSVTTAVQTPTQTPSVPETPPDELSRTPSPIDPPHDEKDLPIGNDNVDWKRIEYFPPKDVARLYHRVRRRLFGGSQAKQQRMYYRKEGRPPYSYVELTAMAIENQPLKSARFSNIVDFAKKHFRFYSLPGVCESKYWKHSFRSSVVESNYFRTDHVGWHAYYSFKSQYRLPTDPAVFENTEEVPTTDSGSEGCDEPESKLPEAEENPLVPICELGDCEMEAAQESLVNHVNEFLALGNDKALSTGDVAVHEELGAVKDVGTENPQQTVGPVGPCTTPAVEDSVYNCSYCQATFSSCQEATDHSLSHPEVTRKCPTCDFTSPDDIQLLWHINASH